MNLIVKVSLVALLVAVSGVLFLSGKALAHHYEFRGEEQKRTDPNHANYISERWALRSGDLRWKADSQIRSKVEDAIEEWEDEIDELGWTRVSSNWDIEFVYEDCRGMHASYKVTDWDYDRTREARY